MTNVNYNIKNILLIIYLIIKYSLSKTRRYLNLFYIIIRYKPKSILEVGVYKGIRSEEMIRTAKIFNKNISFYGFDLFGFVEDMQFTIYDSETYGHYTWHIDMSEASPSTRKLSLVLQLSDPSEYEGGELQTMNSKEPSVIDKKKGLIAAFPGWALHRVTPVTSGIRKTLVVWIAGPQFK